jgi:hypothetical protein
LDIFQADGGHGKVGGLMMDCVGRLADLAVSSTRGSPEENKKVDTLAGIS